MAVKRWTNKEIADVTDNEFLLRLCIDRKTSLTNCNTPLYQKLCGIEHRLVEKIKKEKIIGMIEEPANEPNTFTDVEIKYLNHYRCPDCGNEWEDEWDCEVDDECGECGCRHISPYESDDIEENKSLKSALKHISVLLHDVSYYLGENELLTIEVGDCEYEHIHYMITEGYIEGELNKNGIRGWWKIVK